MIAHVVPGTPGARARRRIAERRARPTQTQSLCAGALRAGRGWQESLPLCDASCRSPIVGCLPTCNDDDGPFDGVKRLWLRPFVFKHCVTFGPHLTIA